MGQHPCFNGVAPSPLVKFDGSKGTKNYIITENKGRIYRYEDIDNTAFVMGTIDKADNENELEDYYAGPIEEGRVSIIGGLPDIYVNLLDSLEDSCSFGIVDDYKYWNDRGEKPEAGKLLLIDETNFDT